MRQPVGRDPRKDSDSPGGVTGTELNERRKNEPSRLRKLKQAAIQSGEV